MINIQRLKQSLTKNEIKADSHDNDLLPDFLHGSYNDTYDGKNYYSQTFLEML